MIVLPYRDDPPRINFIEPEEMLCAFDWIGQQPACRTIETQVGIVNFCEYFELRLKTCVLETCNQLLQPLCIALVTRRPIGTVERPADRTVGRGLEASCCLSICTVRLAGAFSASRDG
ncbi:hypothetical protein D3C85_1341610 [compost metagenome]